MLKKSGWITACVATLASVLAIPCAGAQSAAEFYRGRTMDFVIGYPPGAGYDLFGRVLAQHMGNHIPGNPRLVPKNMPGASSLNSLQYMARTAPRDGSVIGLFNSTLINMAVMDPKSVDIDFPKLSWIGNMSSDTKVCFAMRASGVTKVDDLKTKKLVIGGTAKGAVNAYGMILRSIYGENVKIVLGYPSNADVWLAMEKGEVDANCTGYGILPAKKPEWIEGNKIAVLVQFARSQHSDLKDVPLIYDVPGVPAGLKDAITFVTQVDAMTRPVVGPPGIPADRLKALQDAFMKTMSDPEFLALAKKSALDIDPMDADKVQSAVKEVMGTQAGAVEIARKLLE
jgi:tripartite-type tricarboxylate transporter receptor subunit TctC